MNEKADLPPKNRNDNSRNQKCATLKICSMATATPPERSKLAPIFLTNSGEQICAGTFGHSTACRSAVLTLSAAIQFVMKKNRPLALLFCSIHPHLELRSSTGRYWISKALRSSRRLTSHAETAPPTSSPKMTHFGSPMSIVFDAIQPIQIIICINCFLKVYYV